MDWNNPEERKKYFHQYYNTPLGRAKAMVSGLKRADEKAGRGECTLTEDWIMKNIFTSKCHYCRETDWRVLGCDRINNDLPHTPENVVCCCKSCNAKRGTIPFAVFVQRLKDGEPQLKKNRPDLSNPVIALDKDGNIVCEFPSIRDAGRNGYDPSAISRCCNGERQTHKGLFWQYVT